MQKIIINNFGAIKSADIEIRKVLVLIGEQASGKSTIAKLVYFFKSLRDDLFKQIFHAEDGFDKTMFSSSTKDKFLDWFGNDIFSENFEIIYYYSYEKSRYAKLSVRKSKLEVSLSPNFFSQEFLNTTSEITESLKAIRKENSFWKKLFSGESAINKKLLSLVSSTLELNQNNDLFIIAGRSATVSYSELFEKFFFSNVENSIVEKQKNQQTTVDDVLMLKFIERVIEVKSELKTMAAFNELVTSFDSDYTPQNELEGLFAEKMYPILKAKYLFENNEEKIIPANSNQSIFLSQASSGQQEVIRILQDIFLLLNDKTIKALRIVEEPEAHLFPVAQKQLIELLSLMVNQNEDNQLIITTHSSYVLTVFNNLLFAKRVVEKNPSAEAEVAEIIGKDYWLSATDFSAYSLSNSALGIDNYCESIFSTEKGTIRQNFLDTVSEMLGGDFNALYQIHAKTFARK